MEQLSALKSKFLSWGNLGEMEVIKFTTNQAAAGANEVIDFKGLFVIVGFQISTESSYQDNKQNDPELSNLFNFRLNGFRIKNKNRSDHFLADSILIYAQTGAGVGLKTHGYVWGYFVNPNQYKVFAD